MTLTTAAFDRSSSWWFEASSYKAGSEGPAFISHTAWRSHAFLTQHHQSFLRIPKLGSLAQRQGPQLSLISDSELPVEFLQVVVRTNSRFSRKQMTAARK